MTPPPSRSRLPPLLTSSWFIPSILFFLSFFLRLSLISKGPYNIDCLGLAIAAQQTLETHRLQYLCGTGYPMAVLLASLINALLQMVGVKDYVLGANLMSVVVSSLCIPAGYLFVKKLFDERAAFFSAVTLSFYPIFLALSVYGMSHAPSILFLFLGLTSLVSYLQNQKAGAFALAAIFLGCMGASRVQELTLMVIPISYLFWFAHRIFPTTPALSIFKRLFKFLLFWTLAGLTTFIFHLPYLMPSVREAYFQQYNSYAQTGFWENFMGIFSASLTYSFYIIFYCFTPVGILLVLLGLAHLARRNIYLFIFFLFWFVLPLLFLGNLTMTTGRFIIMPIMALIIIQGYYIGYLSRMNKKVFQMTTLFIYCFINILLLCQMYPILKSRHDKSLLADMGTYIAQHTAPNAKIIAIDLGLFIEYYGHRSILIRPANSWHIDPAELKRFQKTLDKLLAEGTPVYIAESSLVTYNPDFIFSNMIKTHYDLKLIGRFPVEDWHHGDLSLYIDMDTLYKLMPQKIRHN